MIKCYCGSGETLSVCCEPFIIGEKKPETAEKLMRSRYSAYVLGNVDYIKKTHLQETRNEVSWEGIKEWSEQSVWKGLEIISTSKGFTKDSEGIVEFKALYDLEEEEHFHHEKSVFVKENGSWFYKGMIPVNLTIRKEKKIGRNDPCSCGSGKKYKKCCG